MVIELSKLCDIMDILKTEKIDCIKATEIMITDGTNDKHNDTEDITRKT